MKKIITLTLILIMASSAFVFADDMKRIQNDLTKYNIITDYEIGTVNRAEATKIIITMLGIGECERTDTSFIDVPKEYWASGYINTAWQMGIINGHGDGTFKPEQKLTNEQFVKMLVCALGYEPAVNGVYPTGYFMKASQIGITQNLDLAGTDVALRSDVAVMVYNALDIPIMYQNGYGSFTEYVIADGKNGTDKITLRMKLDNALENANSDNESKTITFTVMKSIEDIDITLNEEDYVGRVLKISNLKEENGIYTFNNSLNVNDKATYIVNKDTYVQITSNTVELDEIKDGMYAQCWHYTDDKDDIEILKIELMKENPSGI